MTFKLSAKQQAIARMYNASCSILLFSLVAFSSLFVPLIPETFRVKIASDRSAWEKTSEHRRQRTQL